MGIREGWAVGERAGLVKEARLQGKGVGKEPTTLCALTQK